MKLPLHWQIFLAMVLGVLFALILPGAVDYVEWAGVGFLRLLRMIIVPLIFTSIVTGVGGQSGSGGLGALGVKTLLYYVTTSLLAILTGLFLVNLIGPGVGATLALEATPEGLDTVGSFTELILEMIPTNIVDAMAGGDMLQIIFFCILLGIVLLHLPEGPKQRLNGFFQAGFDAMMKLTQWIMRLAPFGVFAIVADVVRDQAGRFLDLVQTMGMYMLAVALGLAIHALITLPLILFLVARVRPRKHAAAMSTALLTAFSTASSSATLPLTMECAEDKVGVSNRVTSFVLPLGATVNMDGTALYECVAAIFIAQAYGIELTFLQQVTVVFTALLASIGAAGVPMAGLVTITIILRAVGLPMEGVGLILSVDRVLDMMRTCTNVWSDSCGVVTVARLEGESAFRTE